MATDILGMELPANEGASNKVSTYNEAIDGVIENVIAGRLVKSVAGNSNVTLTTAEGLHGQLEFTGALTGNITVFLRVPTGTTAGYSATKFTVYNSTTGAFTLTVKTTASGSTGIAVGQGKRRELVHNGTNVFDAITETANDDSPTFTAPTLLNSWVNFGGVNAPAGYYKRNGRVFLRGLIKSGTIGAVAFTLPTGYRPAYYHYFAVVTYDYVFAAVYVQDNGDVFIKNGNNTFVSLDGISFATL
ncbi:MAG TPA: hypothetical protein VF735_15115 [Pyrinomonadaceae bacterium]|jgi:hypothetical protein